MSPYRTVTPSLPASALPRWDTRPLDRACFLPVATIGLALFGLAWAMAGLPSQPPIVRPMLGVLVAVMLLSRLAAWPALLLASGTGVALAGVVSGAPWTGIGAGLATAAGAGLAAYGWKTACDRRLGARPMLLSTVFIGITAVAAPAVAALIAAITAPAPQTIPSTMASGLSDAIGMLLLAWPTALAVARPGFARETPGRRGEACLMVIAATGLAAVMMSHGAMACILLLSPLSLVAVVRLNGVGLGILLAATAGAATLAAGWMSPVLPPVEILAIRIFFASAVLCLMPMSMILQQMRAALEAARQKQEDAERANRAKSDFLAAMSHDIRIPLTSMIGFADLLEGAGLDNAVTRRAKLIHESGLCILGMVDDIQKFGMLETCEHAADPAPTQLRALLSATVAGMEPQARLRRQTLRLKIAPDIADWVMADAPRLRQVLTNLVSNAVKFGHDGAVEVTLRRGREGPDRLFFAVRDRGPGLTEEEQSKLFRPLMRLDNAATRAVSGTGLGLAICRKHVEAMPEGVIGVTSSPGLGSTFWFEVALPACPAPVPLSDSKRHILVAEDFVVGQKVIAAMLAAEGHTATFVSDGQQAVDAARAGAFDLILMDMDMPVMDGLAATRAVRGSEAPGQHVPIIALTGSVSRQDIENCLAAGMDGHLAKPVDRLAMRAELLRYPSRGSLSA